uniref:Uncharacterized protein n=1 Tax=Lepeophtheirus salmonis TaxID=72036 RepID=A0A0K2UXR2_LEPSM
MALGLPGQLCLEG